MKIFVEGTKRAAVKRMFSIWKNLGHEIVNHPKYADVQFSSVRILKKVVPTLLRLDGIYYDQDCNIKKKNSVISKSHSIADAVIYQSELSQKMCERYLAKRKTKIYGVIYNGVSNNWNSPIEHDEINIIACAKWRRPKRLQEIIQIFQLFRKKYPKAILHVVGNFGKGSAPIKSKNVKYHGFIDHKTMKKLYRIGDLQLHMCKKDSCPSSVVESISAGIPVITTNACGGATEMCKMTKGCIIIPGEKLTLEPEYIYRNDCHKVPIKVLEQIVESMIYTIENKIRVELPKKLHIEYTAKSYIKMMKKIIK